MTVYGMEACESKIWGTCQSLTLQELGAGP